MSQQNLWRRSEEVRALFAARTAGRIAPAMIGTVLLSSHAIANRRCALIEAAENLRNREPASPAGYRTKRKRAPKKA
jgi:hypothetical protein